MPAVFTNLRDAGVQSSDIVALKGHCPLASVDRFPKVNVVMRQEMSKCPISFLELLEMEMPTAKQVGGNESSFLVQDTTNFFFLEFHVSITC